MSEIRTAITAFVSLFDAPPLDQPEAGEALLRQRLDDLAAVVHRIAYVPDEAEYGDAPGVPSEELRARVVLRFPRLGFYNVPRDITVAIGTTKLLVGDAVDDAADILGDLLEVEWRWTHHSEADALWYLQFSHDSHWGEHLRGLQHFLHRLKTEARSSSAS